MSSDQSTTAARLARGQWHLLMGIVAGCGLLWFFSLQSPIPGGGANREKATAFLKEHFPDREVAFAEGEAPRRERDRPNGPVAVIYELIRSAEPPVARRAIAFAAAERFGYAAPYVIERLGSGDAELERAAQEYLRTIAGDNYGPDAESWRAWWRDPKMRFLGLVPIGQTTLTIAIPAAMAFAGFLLMAFGRMGGWWAAVQFGPVLMGFAWLMGIFLVGMRLGGGNSHACSFGSSQITYYTGHGTVVGLEDARIGGMGYWVLLCAVAVAGCLVLVIVSALVRRPPEGETGRALQ